MWRFRVRASTRSSSGAAAGRAVDGASGRRHRRVADLPARDGRVGRALGREPAVPAGAARRRTGGGRHRGAPRLGRGRDHRADRPAVAARPLPAALRLGARAAVLRGPRTVGALGGDARCRPHGLGAVVGLHRPRSRRHPALQHGLVRDAAYGGLSYRRRRELHAAVAATIESSSAEPEESAELLSYHFFQADIADRAWTYSRVAGARAKSLYANVEAARFFQRALDSAKKLSIAGLEVAEVLTALGEVRERLGRYAEASQAFRSARKMVAGQPVAEAELMRKEAWVREAAGRFSDAVRWHTRGPRVAGGGRRAGRRRGPRGTPGRHRVDAARAGPAPGVDRVVPQGDRGGRACGRSPRRGARRLPAGLALRRDRQARGRPVSRGSP